MEEQRDVGIDIELNGEEFTLTRYNTTIYTFWGRTTIEGMEMAAGNVDHIYIQTSEGETETHGGYLFKGHPSYKDLLKVLLKHHFPGVLYAPRVPEGDMLAWMKSNFGDLHDATGIPEGWSTDESA